MESILLELYRAPLTVSWNLVFFVSSGLFLVWYYLLFSLPPLFFQAYGYDDHGISELWMQTYMGESSAGVAQDQAAASQKAGSGSGQLSDEAIRSQASKP